MDNQHRKISGYRELTQVDIDGMNRIKDLEKVAGVLFKEIAKLEGVDPRLLAIARTQLQTSFMWWERAIAQPADPFASE